MNGIHHGLNLLHGFHLLLVFGTSLKPPQTWDKAMEECSTNGKIVSPQSSVYNNINVFSHVRANKMMWSSNYLLNVGCKTHTGVCKVLYVEQILGNKTYQGLCYQGCKQIDVFSLLKTSRRTAIKALFQYITLNGSSGKHMMVDAAKIFDETCNISGHQHSMLRLYNMEGLKTMTSSMKHQKKYWIDGVDSDFRQTGEFVRQCELYRKIRNTTVEKQMYSSSTNSNCYERHSYMCISGEDYHTAISLITLPDSANNSRSRQTPLGDSLNQVIGMVTVVFVLVGLVIIGCLLKRWIKEMRNQIIEYFRQKYENRMYENQQREAGTEAEVQPETPLSPGSSIYDNISNVNTGSQLFRGFDFRENQTAIKEIHHVVAMPSAGNIDGRPRLTIPKNTPSRENAVRQKSSGDQIPTPMKKPPRKDRISKTVSSVSCPINTTQERVCESVIKEGTPETFLIAQQKGSENRRKPSPRPTIKFTAPLLSTDPSRHSAEAFVQPENAARGFYVNDGDRDKMRLFDSENKDRNYTNVWQS